MSIILNLKKMLAATCSKLQEEDISYSFMEVDHVSEIIKPDNENIDVVLTHIKKVDTDYSFIEKRLGHEIPYDFKKLLEEQGRFIFTDVFYLVDAKDSEAYYASYVESIEHFEFGEGEEEKEIEYTYYNSFVIGMSSFHDFCHILICFKKDGTPYLVYTQHDSPRTNLGVFSLEILEKFLLENFEDAISRYSIHE